MYSNYIQSSLNYEVRNDLQSHILENLIVEITWYRPPDSPAHFFFEFEKIVGKKQSAFYKYESSPCFTTCPFNI